MKISTAFPSKFLTASDLQGRNVRVIMGVVKTELVGKDQELKPVLYFQGKDKGMVLNKTNSRKIAESYGDDTDGWAGGELELYMAMVDMAGDTVEAIRVRIPPRNGGARPNNSWVAPPQAAPPPAAPQQSYADDGFGDSDVPF